MIITLAWDERHRIARVPHHEGSAGEVRASRAGVFAEMPTGVVVGRRTCSFRSNQVVALLHQYR